MAPAPSVLVARDWVAQSQRGYAWALPWAGYLGLLWAAPQLARPAIWSGWILLLVWQIIAVGAMDAGIASARRTPARLSWMVAPALLLGTQNWDSATLAVSNALIEITLSEFSALMLSLLLVMWLTPGEDKSMAWPGIIILSVLMGFFLYAFVNAWRLLNPAPDWIRAGALGGALLAQMAVDWRWLRQVARQELQLSDPMATSKGLGLILGQILLWLLLPAVFWLIQA
jgi:hypothetical protein